MSIDTVPPPRLPPAPLSEVDPRPETRVAPVTTLDGSPKRRSTGPAWLLHGSLALRPETAVGILVGYLALPGLIFALIYLHSGISLVALAGCVVFVLLGRRGRRAVADGQRDPVKLPTRTILVFAASGILLSLYTGVLGGFRQTSDWYKHNSMLWDLVANPWPVSYEGIGNPSLVYSFAVYLPAAGVGQLLGGSALAAHLALALWLAFGFTALLIVTAVLLPPRFRAAAALLVIIGFGGADSLGSWITSSHLTTSVNGWWAGVLQYSSSSTAIRWVPQHALSGWALGIAYVAAWRSRSWGGAGLFASAVLFSALWSPFAVIGAAPLGLALVCRLLWRRITPDILTLVRVAALALVAVPGILFVLIPRGGQHLALTEVPLPMVALFVALMAGAWLLSAFLLAAERTALVAPAIFLTLLPLLHLGQFNDIVMRSSFPSLFVLTFFAVAGAAGRFPWGTVRSRLGAGALALAVLLGLPTAQSEWSLAVTTEPSNLAVVQPADWKDPLPAFLVDSGAAPGSLIWIQYVSCLHGRPVALLGLPECHFDPQVVMPPASSLIGVASAEERGLQAAKHARWEMRLERLRYHPNPSDIFRATTHKQIALLAAP